MFSNPQLLSNAKKRLDTISTFRPSADAAPAALLLNLTCNETRQPIGFCNLDSKCPTLTIRMNIPQHDKLFPDLQVTALQILNKRSSPSPERMEVITALRSALHPAVRQPKPLQLMFICTHNSRRSHLCQVWAQVWAFVAGNSDVVCYSGGTEVTEVNRYVLEVLEAVGFKIKSTGALHRVYFSNDAVPVLCFSKRIDAPENPQHNFLAVMTCNEADAACPIVPGALHRFNLPYRDPKIADHDAQPQLTYLERSLEIAGELSHAFIDHHE